MSFSLSAENTFDKQEKKEGRYYYVPNGFEITLHCKEKKVAEKLSKKRTRKTIPRPCNCFIIYRQEKSLLLRKQFPNIKNCDLSKIISDLWKEETQEVKNKYIELANRAKVEHHEKYPNYIFKPRKRSNKKIKKNLVSSSSSSLIQDNDRSFNFNFDCLAIDYASKFLTDIQATSYNVDSYYDDWLNNTAISDNAGLNLFC